MDYILFLKKNIEDVRPNPEEVDEVKWIDKSELLRFLEEKNSINEKTTPWFKKIIDEKLFSWW